MNAPEKQPQRGDLGACLGDHTLDSPFECPCDPATDSPRQSVLPLLESLWRKCGDSHTGSHAWVNPPAHVVSALLDSGCLSSMVLVASSGTADQRVEQLALKTGSRLLAAADAALA
jgi:hypothetical protein